MRTYRIKNMAVLWIIYDWYYAKLRLHPHDVLDDLPEFETLGVHRYESLDTRSIQFTSQKYRNQGLI